MSSSGLSEEAGKQPLNLLVLLAELYNFQVISCRIIYDIIRELIDGMSGKSAEGGEFSVEALLKILRCEWYHARAEPCVLELIATEDRLGTATENG